eukprot:CAMPEP_0117425750 /NCGR_PEP_ID=MMETSP0758-20121206/5991_1 /TAXON_ID=63605 /ORGANISM="Percolomonas cosmopolitus, Strain AE-1 (ATCC 50343)" /LENGTH=364 /DNA_ID=CAMNT_0005210485 /DNA_START=318 /DNA_END=1413 /DNA_ORIENTATION=-
MASFARVGNKIYAIGGKKWNGAAYELMTTGGIEIELETRTITSWDTQGSKPGGNKEKGSMGYSPITQYVYYYGGYEGSTITNSLYVLPITTPSPSWVEVHIFDYDLPGERMEQGSVNIHNQYIVIGGVNDGGPTNKVNALNITEDKWIALAGLPKNLKGIACEATDKIYCFGGQDETSTYTNDIMVLEYGQGNTWWTYEDEGAEQAPTPRKQASIIMREKTLYAWGGSTGASTIDEKLYLYSFINHKWRGYVNHAPAFGIGGFLVDYENTLYAISGALQGMVPNTKQITLNITEETHNCYGYHYTDTQACNGNGYCVQEDNCECHSQTLGLQCDVTTCFGIMSNDTDDVEDMELVQVTINVIVM